MGRKGEIRDLKLLVHCYIIQRFKSMGTLHKLTFIFSKLVELIQVHGTMHLTNRKNTLTKITYNLIILNIMQIKNL